MNKAFAFDDVLIVPEFSKIPTRAAVDTSVTFLGEKLTLPIISANMDSVTGASMANAMDKYGAIGAIHRFQTIETNIAMFRESPSAIVSIGLGDKELERASALFNAGANKILIDVAHGANIEVVRQTKALRQLVGDDASIVVGNFATAESIKSFLYHLGSNYGVEAIKVGIGGGSACTTRIVTGCGVPTLHSILDCRNVGIPIIADGGIRNSGDFSKAIAAGASMVMIGRLLAGSTEANSEYDYSSGKEYKLYKGSASKESYKLQDKEDRHRTPEGESFRIPYTGPVKVTLQQLEAGLRSSMSYVGAYNIKDFQENAQLIQVTNAGINENGAHGKIYT